MVYNTHDYRVVGLCPSSGILKAQKDTTFRKLNLFPSSGEGWETPTLSGPLGRVNLNYWTTYVAIKINSVAFVRERTIPTERPPLVGEVSANFCG
jgi:hypothetical protein